MQLHADGTSPATTLPLDVTSGEEQSIEEVQVNRGCAYAHLLHPEERPTKPRGRRKQVGATREVEQHLSGEAVGKYEGLAVGCYGRRNVTEMADAHSFTP